MWTTARSLAVIAAIGCTGGEAPAPGATALHERHGETMGSTWSVKWVGAEEPRADTEIARVLAEIDRGMSTWRPDSELSAVRAATGPVVVSEDTAFVVADALALAAATGGAFDPTVQPLVEVWGIHGARRTAAPTQAEVDAARAKVGWWKVTLGRDASGRPTIDGGGTALDLSAIAPGHAADRISHALSALHLPDHLVEVGGEVRAMGTGPKGPWRLGIDQPQEGLAPGEQLAAITRLTNRGLATSGNYRNVYEVDGMRVVHTLDPRTGRPAPSVVASVTVVAPDARTADGWATAVMVLGEAALPLLEARPDLDALLLVTSPDGAFQAVETSGMHTWLLHGAP